MEYYLLTQTDFNSFVQGANKLLKDGWTVQGGASALVAITTTQKKEFYAQAFVRKIGTDTKRGTALHR